MIHWGKSSPPAVGWASLPSRSKTSQVLKVDDRIDLDDYRHKKYTELEIDAEEKKKEEEETKRKGSKEGNGKAAVLRHTLWCRGCGEKRGAWLYDVAEGRSRRSCRAAAGEVDSGVVK